MPDDIIAAFIGAIPATIIAVVALKISRDQSKAALKISLTQSQLEQSKAQRDLFEKFNHRFDLLNQDLNALREGVFKSDEQKTEQGVIQDYLNLCSEEYLWYKRGLIDDEIWTAWVAGIYCYLKTPAILNVFLEEQRDASNSYYGFFDVIDPAKLSRLQYDFAIG